MIVGIFSFTAESQTSATGYDTVSVKVNKSGTDPVSMTPGIGSCSHSSENVVF